MRRFAAVVIVGIAVVAGSLLRAAGDPPARAYAISPPAPARTPAAPPAQPDPKPRTLPGSTLSFPLATIRDAFGPADWFPGDHPAMTEVVAKGRRPDVRACSLCHYPNGKGRRENAGVSGLPVAYFIQTMADFKSEARKSADTRKGNTNLMIAYAKAMTDEEVR